MCVDMIYLLNQIKAHPTFNYKYQYFIVNYDINQNEIAALLSIAVVAAWWRHRLC